MRSEPKFASVSVQRQTTITGGLLKKPMAIPIMEVAVGDTTREFVHVAKGQEWLCKAVTGECVSRRPLNRVKLVDTLAKHVYNTACGNDGVDADDLMSSDAFQDDPMNALNLRPWGYSRSPQTTNTAQNCKEEFHCPYCFAREMQRTFSK